MAKLTKSQKEELKLKQQEYKIGMNYCFFVAIPLFILFAGAAFYGDPKARPMFIVGAFFNFVWFIIYFSYWYHKYFQTGKKLIKG